MTYEDSIFVRSFGQHELKKLGSGALLLFFIMAFTICTIFKLPVYSQVDLVKPVHNFSNSRSDVYEMNGDIRIHSNSSTIFVAPSFHVEIISSWTIKPYARKQKETKIERVREWKVKYHQVPNCSRRFTIPAVLFSTGAYSGNYFHAFTDIIIPLYLTCRQFNGKIIFLITDNYSWWVSKYNVILEKLSKYDVVDIDKENEVLCFSRMIVGLKSNKEFGIDPRVSPHYSIKDFRQFLRITYSLEKETISPCHKKFGIIRRPRMLIISRRKKRHLTNESGVAKMARTMGFDVVVKEMGSNVSLVAHFVNSFDVMMGLHGAGLTNMIFLPENAVVIQIVPFGLDVASDTYFGLPARDMKLRYLEYKVSLNESSLLGKYPNDSEVYRDPHAIHKRGWAAFYFTYAFNQEVNLDLGRLRATLVHAFELVCS
ncbi:hypothetical protein RD792_006869 [Penstemon davidsonii]|uniref:Glycosyltransferase 61 catalytic domain-containing protein n=1 Tax=Penstemon davidsonii TaxID=160366 RepID=A0ABR0DBK4_9LAMI|nr:hypothetical protein RD792_006869 [Penstemon davidsonii]